MVSNFHYAPTTRSIAWEPMVECWCISKRASPAAWPESHKDDALFVKREYLPSTKAKLRLDDMLELETVGGKLMLRGKRSAIVCA